MTLLLTSLLIPSTAIFIYWLQIVSSLSLKSVRVVRIDHAANKLRIRGEESSAFVPMYRRDSKQD